MFTGSQSVTGRMGVARILSMPNGYAGTDHYRRVDTTTQDEATLYKALLESTMAIPWKIDYRTKAFVYVGPQIETLLGWDRGSWKRVEDWVALIHPDDRGQQVINLCDSSEKITLDHEADYRIRTKNGNYVWIRDVVHVVRDEAGAVESLIGFMFDISERKKMEKALEELQKKLEILSFEDGLTKVSNRRLFDQRLIENWDDALRTRTPLSLILLDIDRFKDYNDHYGHLRGDECLVQIATATRGVVARPRDIVARYGGEEFVLLLPDTDEAGAIHIAQMCHQAVRDLRLPHAPGTGATFVSVSIGVGTIVPRKGDDARSFVEQVDRRLYAAKQLGRDRVVASGN